MRKQVDTSGYGVGNIRMARGPGMHISLAMLGIVAGTLSVGGLYGCRSRRGEDVSVFPSPDSSRSVHVSINRNKDDQPFYTCLYLKVISATGRIEYGVQTLASNRMKWSIVWEDNNRFVLNSSDIGKRHYTRGPDGKWRFLEADTDNFR